jgi:hypothetical protein
VDAASRDEPADGVAAAAALLTRITERVRSRV